MAGLNLQTGLTGSAVGSLYNGGQSAGSPTRTAVPEGPMTVAQAAYGGGGSGGGNCGTHSVIIGVIAAGLLLFMWWGLPR
jgi:hypothetical protein